MGESAKLCSALYSHAFRKFCGVRNSEYEKFKPPPPLGQESFAERRPGVAALIETGGYNEEKLDEDRGARERK